MPALRALYFSLTLFFVFLAPSAHCETKWNISGGSKQLTENISQHLAGIGDIDTLNALQQDKLIEKTVIGAARALGYYNLKLHWQKKNDSIQIALTPGEPVVWLTPNLSIFGSGFDEVALVGMLEKHPFQEGSSINQSEYDSFKAGLLNKARSLGYRDAKYLIHRLTIDIENNVAIAQLQMDTGTAYTVGEISFSGTRLSPSRLSKMLPIKTGVRYRSALLSKFYSALLDSGYFNRIEIKTVDRENQQIDIQVQLEDAPKHAYTTGIGFSTDTGPRIRLGWDRAAINEKGHRWSNELQASEFEQTFRSEYRIPKGDPINDYVSVNFGWKERSVEDTDHQILETSVARSKLNTATGWRRTYQLSLEKEDYVQGNQSENVVFYAIPGVSWSKTFTKGGAKAPTSGYKYWLNLEGSSEYIGSDTDFIRVSGGLKWLVPLATNHETLFKLEGGSIAAQEFTLVPSSRRFFAGGDQSIRGFGYQTIAPTDDTGELEGGQNLFAASVEYRYRWLENWQIALFTDVGDAFNSNVFKLRKGAGFGLHWMSPIGAIRFDVAKPIDDDDYQSVRLHISMGPTL